MGRWEGGKVKGGKVRKTDGGWRMADGASISGLHFIRADSWLKRKLVKCGKIGKLESAKVRRWILLLCYFLPSSVLLTLTAFSFPALESVVEERFHAAGLG